MSTIDIDRPSDEDIKSLAEQGLTLPLTYHTLKHYLPHRYPFLLVDKSYRAALANALQRSKT